MQGVQAPRSGEIFTLLQCCVGHPFGIFPSKTYLCQSHPVGEQWAMWHRARSIGGVRSLLGGARRPAYASTVLLRPEYSAPSVSNNLCSTTPSPVAVTSAVTTTATVFSPRSESQWRVLSLHPVVFAGTYGYAESRFPPHGQSMCFANSLLLHVLSSCVTASPAPFLPCPPRR